MILVSLPKLADFDWRVDVKTSSDAITRMSMPTCLVQLKVTDSMYITFIYGHHPLLYLHILIPSVYTNEICYNYQVTAAYELKRTVQTLTELSASEHYAIISSLPIIRGVEVLFLFYEYGDFFIDMAGVIIVLKLRNRAADLTVKKVCTA